jgi:DNA-binding NarL/FixJ family response regulator
MTQSRIFEVTSVQKAAVKAAVSSAALVLAVNVSEGKVYLESSITKELVADYLAVRTGTDDKSYDGLTEREHEVLTYLAGDYTNQGIANHLGIQVKTVERHRENVMRKLNMHSRAEQVKYALDPWRRGVYPLGHAALHPQMPQTRCASRKT